MKKSFLPGKMKEVVMRIRPRTVVICILITALLISTSVGVSYSKYTFQTTPYEGTYQVKYYELSSSEFVLPTLTADGKNYRFASPDNAVTVYYKSTAADSAYPNVEKYVAYFQPASTTINYTKNNRQIDMVYNLCLTGIDHTQPLTMFGVVDNSCPLTVAFNVGTDADFTSLTYVADKLTYSNTLGLAPARSTASGLFLLRNIAQLYNPDYNADPSIDPDQDTCSYFRISYNRNGCSAYADTDWYTEDPNANDYYISSAEELAGLATLVNSGISFQDISIYLNADISLADANGYLRRWTPIGTKDNPFEGSFFGMDHTISGLNVADFGASGGYAAGGLFGYVDGITSEISGFAIETAYVSAEFYDASDISSGAIGSVVGWLENGVVTEVTVTDANVCGTAKCGGVIAGRIGASAVVDDSCEITGTSTVADGHFAVSGDLYGYQPTASP